MNSPAPLQQAAAAYARRDLPAAEAACQRALAQHPRDPDAQHLLGLVLRQTGRLAEAEGWIRASLEGAPRRAEFRVNFGNLLRALDRPRDAEEQYRIALELEPGSRLARLALARLLNDAGFHAEAARECRTLIARDARDVEAVSALAAALRGLGEAEAAEAEFGRALALKPDYAAAHHNLGALLGEQGRAEESLAALERAASLGARGRTLQFNRGRALFELGRLDAAEAALAEAIRLEPGNLESQSLLAKLRFMRGEADYARSLASVVTERSRDARLALALGDLLRRGSRPADAERVLRDLLERVGWSPAIGSSLAVLLQEQGRLEEARREAEAAHAAAPQAPGMVENLVAIRLQQGEAEAAWPLILEERERSPLDQRWPAYEATCARLLGLPRYAELYDYARFVQVYALPAPRGWANVDAFFGDLAERLIARHRLATHPLDQSLREGTQTSRSLLRDPDPVIRAFVETLAEPIAEYRARLGADPAHPYTVRNRGATRLTGCWSVRLRRGGYHVNHVHPQGWISSACYIEVPAEVADPQRRCGWLAFGEPRMPTPGAEPAHFVQPVRGRLALFPSYMWHGTLPIRGDEPRMTIAFDAVAGGD